VADAQLKAVITAEDKASKVIAGVSGSLDKVQSKLQSMQPAFKAMAAVGTVALGAISALAFKAVKDYAKVEAINKQLEHAVIDVTHATREQLKATSDLADALERKGVLDGDNIKLGLAQLSTFGLSNEAVRNLGGSLADLAVNQYGVTASGEQLEDSANMIAKALNGQFGILEKSGIRFTDAQKHMIEFGTETQKVTAINEGFQQNLKYTNEVALTTFEGKLAAAKVQLGNVSENIGKALLPALLLLLEKLTPLVEKFVDWSAEHPKLIAGILAASAGLATLVTFVGLLGLALPAIITGFTTMVALMTGPLGIVIAMTAVAAIIWKAAESYKGLKKEQEALNEAARVGTELQNKLADAIDKATDPARKKKLEQLSSDLAAANREAEKLANRGFLGSLKEGFIGLVGKAAGVNDAIISPNGNIITTHPDDYLIATKNPQALFSPQLAAAGNTTINLTLTGNTFMGREGIAEQIGNEIMKALKRNVQV